MWDLYRVGVQMATNIYGAIFNKDMLFLTKLNILNHNIFNSAYAQYYSNIEFVLFSLDNVASLANVTTIFSVLKNNISC